MSMRAAAFARPDNINANIATSLTGPWRIDGTYRDRNTTIMQLLV
jgi:hypothetical protein